MKKLVEFLNESKGGVVDLSKFKGKGTHKDRKFSLSYDGKLILEVDVTNRTISHLDRSGKMKKLSFREIYYDYEHRWEAYYGMWKEIGEFFKLDFLNSQGPQYQWNLNPFLYNKSKTSLDVWRFSGGFMIVYGRWYEEHEAAMDD